jgi:hypothetical protein
MTWLILSIIAMLISFGYVIFKSINLDIKHDN